MSSKRIGFGEQGEWYWVLPDQRDPPSTIETQAEVVGPYAGPGSLWSLSGAPGAVADSDECHEGSWGRRASALLAGIEDAELRADLREAFEERAAIMEHEGGLGRDEAEHQAFLALAASISQRSQPNEATEEDGNQRKTA